jgi:hypothetical protein
LFALHPLKQNEEDKILNGIATFQEKEHHHPFEICSFDETPQFKALKNTTVRILNDFSYSIVK